MGDAGERREGGPDSALLLQPALRPVWKVRKSSWKPPWPAWKSFSDKVENTPDTAENILAAYHPGNDNSGFEKGTAGDWGSWQSTVSNSAEQKHTGAASLKIVQTASATAYSEIGNVPVSPNTEYVL